MYAETKPLHEKATKLLGESRELYTKAVEENRELSADEQIRFDTINDDITKLEKQIANINTIQERETVAAEQLAEKAKKENKEVDEVVDEKEQVRSNFIQWIRFGTQSASNPKGVTAEQVAFNRAQSTTGSEGGFTGAQEFSKEITRALKAFGGMREASRVVPSATGNQLDWPVYDDTSNVGALLAENIVDTEQDIVFANKTLDAFKYTSKIIRASIEILQDSFFNLERDIIMPAFTDRLGRITNQHYTTGTGSGQPNGVITATTSGFTTSSGVAFTATELIEMIHSVDPAYRTGPKVRFMFNDSTLKAIRQLKDSENVFILRAGLTEAEPNILLGFPYTINQDMDSIAVTKKPVLFGDFNHYVIRDVMDIDFIRLEERFRDFHQIGFVAIMRTDADLMTNGSPIKFMTMANT